MNAKLSGAADWCRAGGLIKDRLAAAVFLAIAAASEYIPVAKGQEWARKQSA
ncbi:hypothetical protein [Bacillus xiapuensis]|uniref:hypothetical protein n=1 Tax=Bacillus xiapuensis TaxID=2014075 RepID=UPI0012FD2D6B|nr:hypothetical protein [Bacillus xiapuensis]